MGLNEQFEQNKQLIKIGDWVFENLNKFEVYILLIFIIGLTFRMFTEINSSLLIIIPLLILGISYFLKSFSTIANENISGLERFIYKLASWSASVSVVGICYKIESWPGADTMLFIGITSLIIAIPLIIYKRIQNTDLELFDNRLFVRLLLILTFSLTISLTQNSVLEEIGLTKKINTETIEE